MLDLDRTLIADRTILHLADAFDVRDEVERIWAESGSGELAAGEEETRRIAALFAGIPVSEFVAACSGVPFRQGARQATASLKRMGFTLGVVSASYQYATKRAMKELGLDLEVSAVLEERDGHLTGGLLPSGYKGACGQWVCKEAVLKDHSARIDPPVTVAVGDGRNDLCMLRAADIGIAVEPAHEEMRKQADIVVRDLRDIPVALKRKAPWLAA